MRMSFAGAVHQALQAALAEDPRVKLIGDGVVASEAPTTRGLSQIFPDRVFDLPIADRGTSAYALGLALAGQKPIVEVSSTGRLLASLEVISEAARFHLAGEFPANLIFRVSYGTEAGPAVDAPVLAALTEIPGLKVVCAASTGDVAGLMATALRDTGPVILLESRSLLAQHAPVSSTANGFGLRCVRPGTALSLISWGAGVGAALDAAHTLGLEGHSPEVLDLCALSPLDRPKLGEHVRRSGRSLVIFPSDLPFGEKVSAAVLAEAFEYLEAPPATAVAQTQPILSAARAALTF